MTDRTYTLTETQIRAMFAEVYADGLQTAWGCAARRIYDDLLDAAVTAFTAAQDATAQGLREAAHRIPSENAIQLGDDRDNIFSALSDAFEAAAPQWAKDAPLYEGEREEWTEVFDRHWMDPARETVGGGWAGVLYPDRMLTPSTFPRPPRRPPAAS